MFTTALPRCTLFVLVLSRNVTGGKLPPNNIEEISTTPSLLSTTTSTSDNVESGKLLAKGNLEGHCRTLRTLRNSFRKLVNESCKSETNVTRGNKSRRERLPENCVQFTKEYIRPCIQDDRLDEECMEAILNVSFIFIVFFIPMETKIGLFLETGCSDQGMCLRGTSRNSPGAEQDISINLPLQNKLQH